MNTLMENYIKTNAVDISSLTNYTKGDKLCLKDNYIYELKPYQEFSSLFENGDKASNNVDNYLVIKVSANQYLYYRKIDDNTNIALMLYSIQNDQRESAKKISAISAINKDMAKLYTELNQTLSKMTSLLSSIDSKLMFFTVLIIIGLCAAVLAVVLPFLK